MIVDVFRGGSFRWVAAHFTEFVGLPDADVVDGWGGEGWVSRHGVFGVRIAYPFVLASLWKGM